MIVKEFYKTRNDGVNLYRYYSDAGYMMVQVETGATYGEAIDVEGAPYTYEETDTLIEGYNPNEISAEELMSLIEEVL